MCGFVRLLLVKVMKLWEVRAKREARLKRKKRVRKKVFGTEDRPRFTVFRSARHIYAQVVTDTAGRTLASASTLDKEVRTSEV